jgi:ATP-binding cassette, subfamily C, bacterial LapB
MKVKDFLVETLTGLSTIKASAMEQQMQRRFERLQQTAAEQSFDTIKISEETQALSGLLSNLTQMVTVTVGAVFVIQGETSVGALACCVMLAGRAIQPLLRLIAVWNELQSVVVGVEKAEPLLRLPPAPNYEKLDPPRGALDVLFANVSFRHSESSPLLMRDASFIAPAGSITAISGRDGSGKSTIADLLCGYLTHHTGDIRIGGVDPRLEARRLKRCISIVRPGAAAMRGSIIDNITMFRKGEEVELAMKAARLIGLDADIYRLPRGYQTTMSEGLSGELPAGLVQRIAIARAIARRPGLLILDEANGALDMKSDRALIEGLMRIRGYTTIIVITNRPSLAAIADQRLWLENGVLQKAADQPASIQPSPKQVAN